MDKAEFLIPYQRDGYHDCDLPPHLDTLMAPARQWSAKMGELLYDRLDTGVDEAVAEPTLNRYAVWLTSQLRGLNDAVLVEKSKAGLRCNRELNFHRMSQAMFAEWHIALTPQLARSEEMSRHQAIRVSQYLLAEQGLGFYSYREKESSDAANYSYFDPARRNERLTQEALVTEFDTAEILLNIAQKHKGMTVLPAPAQFEHASVSHNADFIVLGDQDKVIGVQVKTHVRSDDTARYDPTRIILVDGEADFSNQIFRRTSRISSEKVIGWAGVICSHQVLAAKDVRRQIKELSEFGITPQRILAYRALARRQAGNFKSTIKTSTDIVEKRLMASLQR